jgi:glutaredoxin
MFPSSRLLHACRITLFTREHCGLCVQAKAALSSVWDARPFDYREVDIVKPEAKAWRDLYDFDVPVVGDELLLGRLKSDRILDSHIESGRS